MYRSGAIFIWKSIISLEKHVFIKKYRCFFTSAHPIHAIFMILRQREAPLMSRVFGMVLTGIYRLLIRFIKDFPNC